MLTSKEAALGWLTGRFELSKERAGQNLRHMEGLRGFAVFLVFLVHYDALIRPWIKPESFLSAFSGGLAIIGNSGVDLFFVLSGYLIYGSLISRPQAFQQYIVKRLKRIYPAFTAVFITYVALSFIFPAENKIPKQLAEGVIYLLQNFFLFPGLFPIQPMITVAWSLSYEFFYYLMIPIVIGTLGLRQRSAFWRVCFFASVTTIFTVYCAINGGPVRLIMFISGILLHEATDWRRWIPSGSAFVLLVVIAGFIALLLPFQGAIKAVSLFVAYFVLCGSCFNNPAGWLPRLFLWTPMRWLGNMSYSYFLLHGLCLKACFLVLSLFSLSAQHGMFLYWSLLPVIFVLSLIPTAGLFLVIERPLSLAPSSRQSPHQVGVQSAAFKV